MYYTALEFPINCVSLNRDCSQIVAAGRNVFKVFSIEENEFVEKFNLRTGRNNLTFSAMDVVWNPVEDHIIASAATNGAVVTWNLNKPSRNKQDQIYNEHKRAVSKVAFHSNEYHLLMSGSQDGFMKIFDLRKKGVSEVFFGRSESVRDIQFHPHQYFQFAAAYESGNVQIWDIRAPTRFERQFTAHGEHVLSIDFHPEEKHWLATSGRDKLIKVWDMSDPARTKNSHVVQTITPVAQIKWRPLRKYHIASCSLLLDFSVNIWDIRRPYIPFAAFNEHKDCVTEAGRETASMYYTALEFPINCVSLNRDCSQIVAAGRNVFKVFSIEENEFVEKFNLRTGRNNLTFSAMDVVWNPVEDHIIASAATNGAVVTWNLNKPSRNKQDQIYNEHKRAVSKVAFHSNEYHLLMSGSQDGFMKIFDLRKKGVSEVFFGRSESVRDIQFHPHQYFQFAAAYESGNVQIWDIRAPTRFERQFTAHGEHVLSIDFHPEEKHWLATSGRDKLIKVWDMSDPARTKNSHVVQTITPVAQIKWRPLRKYHIASCSLLLDFSVNIWDIRRPYIPFAAFNEHKDCVTGIQWKANDPQVFFSSSKDCSLYAHAFKHAVRPADSANPVSIDLDANGRILHATSNKVALTPNNSEKNSPLTLLPARFRKAPDRTELFTMVTSVLLEFSQSDKINQELDMRWFTESAHRYKLTGKTIDELCQHNAEVAEALQRRHVAQSWRMLRLLFSCSTATPPAAPVLRPTLHRQDGCMQKGDPQKDSDVKQKTEKEDSRTYDKDSADTVDTSTVSESDDSDSEDCRDMTLANIASGHGNRNHSDLFFVDTDQEPAVYDFDELSNLQKAQEGSLPEEALQLRLDMEQEIGSESPQQSLHSLHAHHGNADSHISIATQHTGVTSQIRQELLSMPQFTDLLTPWKFKHHVCDLLQYYADKGDVQTAVSMLIVLGDEIKRYIDENVQEQWYIAYIDILTRFKLYSLANRVMKLSGHAVVGGLNQRSTTIQTNCAKCNKTMMRAGWLCDRCTNRVHTCSLCHQPVKGLYVWCQGCSHGGHVTHMKQWFSTRTSCPAGCGHLCEYT